MHNFLTIYSKKIFITFLALIFLQSVTRADDFTWQTYSYNESGNRARPVAQLVFGIPETDNQQFRAQCRAGAGSMLVHVEFSYHTGALARGTTVDLAISTAQFNRTVKGRIKGPDTEEGISGVTIDIPLKNPFWQALASGRTMQYGTRRQNPARMGLSGSGQVVRTFLKKCRSISATSIRQPGRGSSTSEKITCDNFNKQSSKQSKTRTTVTFINRTSGSRAILWIDFKGQPIDYAMLDQGQSWTVKTYLTHPWMITDGPGNCLEMFMPKIGVNRFEITKPNRYFGPE